MKWLSKWLDRRAARNFYMSHRKTIGRERAYYQMKWIFFRKPNPVWVGIDNPRAHKASIDDLHAQAVRRRKAWEARREQEAQNLKPLAGEETMRQAVIQIAAGMCANRTLCWEPDELAKAAVAQAVEVFKALKEHQEKANG